MTDLVYVYAVVNEPVAGDVTGLEGQTVRWVREGQLAAAVSDVPGTDFDEAPLNERVGDMAWLGPRAVSHQEVNAVLHDRADTIVPLAFGTVFRDDDRVRQLLRESEVTLSERLEAVRGCAEWVVALHMLAPMASGDVARQSPELQRARAEVERSAPGRAHLLRRRVVELERDEARRIQTEAAAGLISELRLIATDVFEEDLPADAVERPLVRASVLVSRAAEEAFLAEIERLRRRWPEPTYRLLLTGPWPPYRFGGLERSHV